MKRITVDVRDLKPGDIILNAGCEDDGPVRSHRPHLHDAGIEIVYFEHGKDSFGAPQQLDVLRG